MILKKTLTILYLTILPLNYAISFDGKDLYSLCISKNKYAFDACFTHIHSFISGIQFAQMKAKTTYENFHRPLANKMCGKNFPEYEYTEGFLPKIGEDICFNKIKNKKEMVDSTIVYLIQNQNKHTELANILIYKALKKNYSCQKPLKKK